MPMAGNPAYMPMHALLGQLACCSIWVAACCSMGGKLLVAAWVAVLLQHGFMASCLLQHGWLLVAAWLF